MANIDFIAGGELEVKGEWMWTSTPLGFSEAPVSGVAGAHGKVWDNATWGPLSVEFPATQRVTGRIWYRFATNSDNETFWQFFDSGTEQVRLVHRSNGSIQVVRQSDVLATSATGLFSINTNYELEFRVVISNGAGAIAVNRNGSQIICVPSGIDTQVSGSPSINEWSVGSAVLDTFIDDAVLDRSGTYLGTGEVETLMPNGDGDVTQLTPSTLAANYSLVDEKPHDGDTSYVESTGSNQTDVYTFENISLSGTPLGVMLSVAARHTVGSPTCKLVCRIDGDNYESSTIFSSASTYRQHFNHAWPMNPATGLAWTEDEINSAQWGVRCLATGMRITQVGLQVYIKAADSDQCIGSGTGARDYCGVVDEDLN